MYRAVGGGHVNIIEILLEKGADVNLCDKAGRTPLHWAALTGAVDCGECLLKHNANIDAQVMMNIIFRLKMVIHLFTWQQKREK